MSQFHTMPFRWGDFFATATRMTDEGAKAYLLLLGHCWDMDAQLPGDDAALARLARLKPRQWLVVKNEVLSKFERGEDGLLRQAKVTETYQNVVARSQKNSENGSKGGKIAAEKRSEIKEPPQANAVAGLKHLKTKRKGKDLDIGSTPSFDIEPSTQNSPSASDGATILPFARPEPAQPSLLPAETHPPKRTAGQAFELFWKAYPKKTGKDAAAKRFRDVARSGRVSFEQLMAALEAYKQSKPIDRPWCNPLTWLTQGRWADEPEAPIAKKRAPDV